MDLWSLISLQITLFILMMVGALLKKTGVVSAEGKRCLSDLCIKVVIPCNIFKSFLIDFTPDILTCGDLSLNTSNAELRCGGTSVVLPRLEFKLMELLMNNLGICLSTEDMLTKVWGYDTDADIGVVWVYISYLRKRLTALGSNIEIKARRGVGYTLEAPK